MSNVAGAYGSNNQTVTITLASLASGASRQSSQIVVSGLSPIPLDILVTVKLKAGSTNTGFFATLYACGSTDGGTTFTDNAGTTDAAITLPTTPNAKYIGTINMPATATSYVAGPFGIAAHMDGSLPANLVLVVNNATGGALDATGANHSITYQAVYDTVI